MFDEATIERFMALAGSGDGCHEWRGSVNQKGYGRMKIIVDGRRKYVAIHRYSLALHTGHMPPSSVLALHSCDNPICTNPNHLRWGTVQDNADDKVKRKRTAGGGKHASPFTEDDIREIRNSAMSRRRLALRYGVTPTCITHIRSGKNWARVRPTPDDQSRKRVTPPRQPPAQGDR